MKRIGRITRRGSTLLRGMLVEGVPAMNRRVPAWMVWRHNDWAKSFVARISRGMKLQKEDRHRGTGEKTAGDPVGDAAEEQALASAGACVR